MSRPADADAAPGRPDVSVVLATAGRRVGLLWALDALALQVLPGDATLEVLVVHTAGPVAEPLQAAAEHPLVVSGVARIVADPAPFAAGKRNAGWRAARAPLVAFTDDDCRPRPDWAAAFLRAHRADPTAYLQGGAAIDPDQERVALRAPRPRLQTFVPPTPWAELCSAAVPRAALQHVGGLDETFERAGEDTDLAWRLRDAGAPWTAVPGAVVDHAVETPGLRGALRVAARFVDAPRLVRRHPGLRAHFAAGLFFSPAHAWWLLGVAGVGRAVLRCELLPLGLTAPWLAWHLTRYGRTPRGAARAAAELPGDALIDGAQVAAFVAASVRERTPLL
ncbi:glycosyltransferase family 2 protein [Patulibacter sp.]|uniref:glycosyltransferase family 2 protein n=1 Tax=Patulibacter sp. TaxID=1912859 RepID=UPI002720A57A|nr:glycosyltransferase [Patulibacter sp.]MDO9408621.1 glycosyltransferase [Patulibacter sp.]